MTFGHWGKALRVNLTTGTITTEVLSEEWLRRYVGGWGIIAYHLLKEVPRGADPLGPENRLIFTTGTVTGQPVAGGGRHMVGAKSPLTGGFGASESGGFFGAELKRAGWDTIIFEGCSPTPVYLWIKDDVVELRPAGHLWGLETADCEERLQEELGDKRIRVAQIGRGGENLVRVANVINDVNRAAGRSGMGAVMGSKKLRAVVVRGTQRPPAANPDKVNEMAKWVRDHYKETGAAVFSTLGTMRMIRNHGKIGALPTRNFGVGVFEHYENLTAERQMEQNTVGRDTCFGCPIRCKWVIEIKDDKYPVDRRYGGPEYETAAAMGSLCGIDDLRIPCRANQLCNAYGLDTIGTGVTIAWAMECMERGLITLEDTGGLDLRFGNADALLEAIELISTRTGFGAVLAEGSRGAAEIVGKGSVEFTMQVKGQEFAMHDPRIKFGHGIGDAVSPTGADHMHNVHDNAYETKGGISGLMPFGVLEPLPFDDLSADKARMVRYGMLWRVTNNLTGICMFHPWEPQQVAELITAVTGWNTSVMELWLAAERAYDMARAFNTREGFGPEDDRLPPRFHEGLPEGPSAGHAPSVEQMEQAKRFFYGVMGWDPATAAPTRSKLQELGIGWVADQLEGGAS
ncbi:MAG: aldehyde ferredoxin oxidoreductase family protein [Anaerolineae bacterium]